MTGFTSTRIAVLTLSAAALTAFSGAAQAGTDPHAADASLTSSTLSGGNRQLTQLRFAGSTTAMTGADFLRFNDGSLTNNVGTYGWSSVIPSDLSSGGSYSGNPDRTDTAAPFSFEGSGGGTLADVFGPFGATPAGPGGGGGYKNMSYLIDGEDNGAWTLDLYLAGLTVSADADASTIELAILERGMNSDIRIRGIRADHSLTSPYTVGRASFGSVGWAMDTLEIDGSQTVGGVGLSLDASWTNLIGVRLEAADGMNGPDIVGVAMIPTPGSAALLGLGGMLAARRRRVG